MFTRAASGPGGRSVELFEGADASEEKLGGGGLLYRLVKPSPVSTKRRNERAGWGLASVGGDDEDSVLDGPGGSSFGCWH
jgi:hypothetical protein